MSQPKVKTKVRGKRLIDELRIRTNLPLAHCRAFTFAYGDIIAEALERGECVRIPNVGTFVVRVVNTTGTPRRTVSFRRNPKLKKRVRGNRTDDVFPPKFPQFIPPEHTE